MNDKNIFLDRKAIFPHEGTAMEFLNSEGFESKCVRCDKIYFRTTDGNPFDTCFGCNVDSCEIICKRGYFDWETVENTKIKNYGCCSVAYLLKFRKSCPFYKNKVKAKVVEWICDKLKKIGRTLKYYLELFSSLKQGTQVIIMLGVVFVFCSRDFFNSIVNSIVKILDKLH